MARRVHTAHGPGTIVESETVRGRTSHRVEGTGFSIWVMANELGWDEDSVDDPNLGNTTELPYDPTPQVPSHSDFATIVPGEEEVDADERLSPIDSLDVVQARRHFASEEPAPNPELFATEGIGENEYHTDTQLPGEQDLYDAADTVVHEAAAVGADPELGAYVVISTLYGDRVQTDSRSFADRLAAHPEAFSLGFREARAIGHVNPYEDYNAMLRTSATMRESAWADVRNKSKRLRATGCVDVVDEDAKSVMANVQGDHGNYETFVIRQGYLNMNAGVSEWSCSCPWGFFAHKRRDRFVGRMCSHAYATYTELQKLNWKQLRGGSKTADVEKGYVPMGEYTDEVLDMPTGNLELEPQTLVPELNDEVLRETEIERADLNKDTAFHTVQTRDEDELRTAGRDDNADEDPDYTDYAEADEDEDRRARGDQAEWREAMVTVQAASDDELLHHLRTLSDETERPQHEEERNDEVRDVVEELRERGYDADNMVANVRAASAKGVPLEDLLLHEPFNGSGPREPLEIGTSEEYVESDEYTDRPTFERHDMDDDLDGDVADPTKAEMERARLNKDVIASAEDDVVAQFQREAGAAFAPGAGGFAGSGSAGGFDIAGGAQAFLQRTAGRHFSFAEQQELVDERAPGGADNLGDLDLEGTHYVDLA